MAALGWLLNLDFAASADGSAPVVVPSKKGGRSKKKTVRYIVEIDGEQIAVSSISEAESLLLQARELAKESAPRDVAQARTRIKPPRIAVKTASGARTTSATLQRAVSNTQEAVSAIYRKAAENIERDREIARLIQRKLRDEDDEEAITVLLL